MTDYLRPKISVGNLKSRTVANPGMEDGMFRNPPTFTQWGGFSSERKLTDPSGKRLGIGGMSLERGGPSARKGKPI